MHKDQKHIVDQFGRVHDYLRISLTERCNLRCFYCMPEEGIQLREKSEFMSSEELIEIAKKFVELGVKKIRLTGGEPLIKKDFANIIHELGKLPVELAITTNAVLIDKYIDNLKAAGVKNINVSLDSLKEDRFNAISRRNYFKIIRSNIQLLIENNFNVKINVVLIKGVNEDEIPDFIEWTIKEKIHVRFIEFMPFDGNNWNTEKKISLDEITECVKSQFGEKNVIRMVDGKNDTTKNYKILNSMGSFGVISSMSNPFCSTCNRIRLTADGKIKNCLFSQSESDLLSALRNGEVIEDIIKKAIFKKFRERGGFDSFDNDSIKQMKNRTMVAIGG